VEIKVSVRGLVEFLLRTGNIDNRKKSAPDDAMAEGSRIHRMIQKKMGSSYHAEVMLRYRRDCGEYDLVVEGRADGIIDSDPVAVDEIKGTYRDLSRMKEPLSNRDAKLRNQMRAEIIKLRERIDTTFIYVTHDQTEAMTLGDRIVIMKDGFIQQIGTPQEVFDHPANLFVAGFIGVPQMNFFDARLSRRDGKYAVTVGSVTVELSPEKQQRLAAHNVAEQDVTLGVRPDHIMLCADGVKGTVDVSEMMGSSVHLHVTAEGKDVIVIVPTNGAAAHFPMGSEVNMIFGGNVAHVFDKTTGKNLEW